MPYGSYAQGHHAIREPWGKVLSNGNFQANILAAHKFNNLLTAIHTLLVRIKISRKDIPNMVLRSFNLHTTQVYLKSNSGWKITNFHATVAQESTTIDALPELLH